MTTLKELVPLAARNITEALWHVVVCKDDSTIICSGSLINDNFIVTTADCVCNNNSTADGSISVKMNKNHGCAIEETNGIEYDVTHITCHPMYNSVTYEYNIALLKLAVIINTTLFAPICLPTAKDTSSFAVDEFAGVYGYGHFNMLGSASADGFSISTVYDDKNELLFEVTQIVSNNECSIAYNSSVPITNHMTCTSKLMTF